MNFEIFLEEKYADQYMGTDDDMSDGFSEWVTDLSIEEICKFADEYKEL